MSTRSYIAIEKFNSNNVPYYDAIYIKCVEKAD